MSEDADVEHGKTIKLFKMPLNTYFKMFRVLVSATRTDYIITNDLAQSDTEAADRESSIRWKIKQLHREEKQITGIESCQCRHFGDAGPDYPVVQPSNGCLKKSL